MDEIIADYVTGEGIRIVCSDKLTWLAYSVKVYPPNTVWPGDKNGLVAVDNEIYGHWRKAVAPTAEFMTFCAGVMPPYVFADWLEENVPDIPPHALTLLRLPYNPRPVYTSGRNVSSEELAPSTVSG